MFRASALVATLSIGASLFTACGDAAEAPIAAIPMPHRTAVRDLATRALIAEMARHRACDAIVDRFLPLPEDRPGAQRRAIEGRLWVNECRVERDESQLSLHVSGRGWQWVERSAAGPLGSSFTVRGTVRLEASFDVTGVVDLAPDVDEERVRIALTPTDPPRAQVTPIGTIPVEPDGGWSGLIGGLGGLFGISPREQARPLLEEQAALMVRRQLAEGATVSIDLCTGQPDVVLGVVGDDQALAPPPFDPEGVRWVDNARVHLHPGGLDLSGPWDASEHDMSFELDVESGGPVEVTVLCRADAALLASSYLAGGTATVRQSVSRQQVSGRETIGLSRGECDPHVLMTAPVDTRVRYRVRRDGEEAEALIGCE